MTNHSLAFVFPGQGSQALGMLKENQTHPIIAKTLAQANEALGYDLAKIMFDGPEESLNQTEITQPALLTCSVALWRVWCDSSDIRPVLLAGHSLGEYSALVAADVIDFQDAVKLVALRGKFMQTAVPAGVGAMAAILGMEDDAVETLCNDCAQSEVLAAVNYNSPGQIVIAGNKSAVDRACVEAKTRGAKRALPLAVSVPSHCALMLPAAEMLTQHLQSLSFKTPQIPVIHNVDVQTHSDTTTIKNILAQQLYMPVRFTQTIQTFTNQNINIVIECGSGKVLTGLIKRINPNIKNHNLSNIEDIAKILETI